jgi:ABC-type multidrug transport system fused ATPase/permease subunit
MKSLYSRVGLNLFTYEYQDYSFLKLLILSVICTCIHTIIYTILALCKERWYGRPPLGWKYLFSFGKWKRLFDPEPISTSATDLAIRISNVNKTFKGEKEVHALKDFSLDIKQGEIFILIGPNGCGKTTLISSITTALKFDTGEIAIYDNNIEEVPNAIKTIGIVFSRERFY